MRTDTRLTVARTVLCVTMPIAGFGLAASKPEFQVRAATSPISVNGILSEWGNADSISFGPYCGADDSVHGWCARVKALWDFDKLYVAYSVRDTSLTAAQVENDDSALWRDDCVELYLSMRPHAVRDTVLTENEYQFIVNLNGSVATYSGCPSESLSTDSTRRDISWNTDILAAVRLQGTLAKGDRDMGYTVELAIYWASLNYSPLSGDTLLADFCVENRDIGRELPWFDWVGLDVFADPPAWARLILNGHPSAIPTSPFRALQDRYHSLDKLRRNLPWIVIALLALGTALGIGFIRIHQKLSTASDFSARMERLEKPLTYSQGVVAKVITTIKSDFSQELKTADIAKRLFVSERHLQRILKQEKIAPVRSLMSEMRITRAKELIEKSSLTLTQIGFEVGFQSFDHFRRTFKQRVGISASEYRRKCQSSASGKNAQ